MLFLGRVLLSRVSWVLGEHPPPPSPNPTLSLPLRSISALERTVMYRPPWNVKR